MSLKEPENHFLIILVTDGKANVPLVEKAAMGNTVFEELQRICYTMKSMPMVDFFVVDTEKKNKFMKMDIAFKIAEWLSAKYFFVDELKSEALLEIVRAHKIF